MASLARIGMALAAAVVVSACRGSVEDGTAAGGEAQNDGGGHGGAGGSGGAAGGSGGAAGGATGTDAAGTAGGGFGGGGGDPSGCAPGYVTCGTPCFDLARDPANCGACGNACGPGDTCVGGHCGQFVGQPPSAPSGPPGDGIDRAYAWNRVLFGEMDWQGNWAPIAWRQLGYNLDGQVSGPDATDVCVPYPGANPAQVNTDGMNGIDNSFGENVVPALVGLTSGISLMENDALAAGRFTQVIRISKLGLAANYSPLEGAILVAGSLGSTPKWDGTDVWPVAYESVVNGDPNAARETFPASFVANRTWVSGAAADVDVPIRILGATLIVKIHHAVVSMDLAPDDSQAAHGMVAGVLDAAELGAAFTKLAGSMSTSLCSGSTLAELQLEIAQASDILKDGTQDPTKPCDGISIGLGFTARTVQIGSVVPPNVPTSDPCSGAADAAP